MRSTSMKPVLFATFALALSGGAAMAQMNPATGARPGNVIGTGQSLPLSSNASNINATDTHNVIAPRLPNPAVADSAGPRDYLMAARTALAANKTGEAQEALERAESRALAGNVLASRVDVPSQQAMVQTISSARHSLAAGDKASAMQIIDGALHTN